MEQVIKTIQEKLTKHILQEGVCLPYILKFKRCVDNKDFIRLGLQPQSINFVIDCIKKGVVTKHDIVAQLSDYINGNYVVDDVLEQVEGYSAEYYCDFNDSQIVMRTSSIHLIGCSNTTIVVPMYQVPTIYISNECKDIKIISQGLNIININIYEDCNVILSDVKTAKSVNVYKFGKRATVLNEKNIKNLHTFDRIFKTI